MGLLRGEWSALRERLRVMLRQDVARFNELMRDLGPPAVIVEAGRTITDEGGPARRVYRASDRHVDVLQVGYHY